ncbi:MAG: hypothetical protein JSW58_15330 [Candidatus Latescibacterota bacterium]|nr:MAG: hypothetical protein JSW58_15330 [Candidatus Latescibacterota bacterium]
MKEHVTILGALYIAFSAQGLLAATIVLVAVAGGGLLSGDPDAIAITSTVGVAISSLLFVLSVPGLIGGIGLLKRISWSRYLVLIVGCFNLMAIPFGTALGIYTIWVLVKPETVALFETPKPTTSPSSDPPR